ncbi:histidinol dehydrogenase, partial [Ochrobactrum sp. SFR4]|uniref:histidinol dehydrogenase n=1 Tax=Ochrobactrum sp. SFR4 TaxID=2717368 RepID=UPI001C8CDF29|nr:histidinol dehydrogenase [Ochrobactrum sp. SFR4]
MVQTLIQSAADFEASFVAFLAGKREVSEDVDRAVREIVQQVRQHGDQALIDYSKRFDRIDLGVTGIAVTQAVVYEAVKHADQTVVDALNFARDRVWSFHHHKL